VVFRDYRKYVPIPLEAVLYVINFIPCWGMNIQISDMTSDLLVLYRVGQSAHTFFRYRNLWQLFFFHLLQQTVRAQMEISVQAKKCFTF
jgi:hypothetical protein